MEKKGRIQIFTLNNADKIAGVSDMHVQKDIFGKFTAYLASLRLAVGLIALLVMVSATMTFLPTEVRNQEFSSWWFSTLLGFFGVNLAFCTTRRIKLRLQQSQREEVAFKLPEEDAFAVKLQDVNQVSDLKNILIKCNYQVKPLNETSYFAEKNKFSWWGSIGFHIGIITLLLGFLINDLWGWNGIILTTEKETVLLEQATILKKGPLAREISSKINLVLNEFTSIYGSSEVPSQYKGKVSINSSGLRSQQIFYVNDPISFKGIEFIYSQSGFSPFITIESNSTQKLENYLNVATQTDHKTGAPIYGDKFKIFSQLDMEVQMFPDFDPASQTNKSYIPQNPVVQIKIFNGKELLFDEWINLGESRENQMFKVGFQDLRQWVKFYVNSDPGEMLIVFSLLMISLGTSMRFLFPRKRIWFQLSPFFADDKSLMVYGRTEYYNLMFQQEIRDIFSGEGDQLK